MNLLTIQEIEERMQQEYMRCPGCKQDVHTVAAEGVPAQSLRGCMECGAVFIMDTAQPPRYTKEDA